MFHFMTLIQLLSQMLFIDHHLNIHHHLNNDEKNHPRIKIEKVFNYTFKKAISEK